MLSVKPNYESQFLLPSQSLGKPFRIQFYFARDEMHSRVIELQKHHVIAWPDA